MNLIARVGCAALLSALSLAALAQSGRIYRIGVLSSIAPTEAVQRGLRDGLREHGYVEGRNLQLDWRSADGKSERIGALAAELVQSKPDVIVTVLTPAAKAVKTATRTIPIVMAYAGDPVETGLVASLARPGGNLTGLSASSIELSGKRLELLREVIPGLAAVALLVNGTDPFAQPFITENQVAARRLGIQVTVTDVRRREDVPEAFARIAQGKAGAVMVQGVLTGADWRTAHLSQEHRVPAMSPQSQFADAGGLFSFGASTGDLARRAGNYVHRILKGAKPGEMPVEQPTRFELVINLKAAKSLGVAIPAAVMVRADRVIE